MLQTIIRTMIIIWLAVVPYRIAYAGSGKTLERTIDPVVMEGSKLGILNGKPIASLALFVYRSDGFYQIPFQVDEKTPDGQYAFAVWKKGAPVVDDGLLDENDELVFMAADLGDEAEEPKWPDGGIVGAKIIAIDPDTGGKGFAYLYVFSGDAPVCPADYVVLHEEKNEIETLDYIVAYDPKAPIAIGKLAVNKRLGAGGQNVADRLKIRIKGTVRWNLFEIQRDETGFITANVAYTDGPVRVLRYTKSRQKLFFNIPSPSTYMTSIYYKNQMQFPITIELPFDVSGFFEDISLRVSVDTPDSVKGRMYYNNNNPQGLEIDGVMSDAEKNINTGQYDWQVVAGTQPEHPEGWFSRQLVDTKGQKVTLPLYYQDDISTPDPPENIPGSCGNLGFWVSGVQNLKKGSIDVMVQQFPVINYKPGDEKPYMKVYDRPLTTFAQAFYPESAH